MLVKEASDVGKKPRKPRNSPTKGGIVLHHESIGDGVSNVWRGDVANASKYRYSLVEFGGLARTCRLFAIPLIDKTPTKRS